MNARERLEAALNGRPVDRLPFSPFLAYIWEHFPQQIRDMGQLAFHHHTGADPLWRGAPCPVRAIPPAGLETQTAEEGRHTRTQICTPVGTLQQTHMRSDQGNTHFLVEHPLKTPEDFKVQLWIEENTRFVYDPEPVAAHFSGPGSEGLSLGMLIPRGKSAYQTLVEHLVGTEELIYALVDFPDVVETLWQTMVARDLEAVHLALQSDYTYFITWEDSSTQNYSPTQYDTYIGSEIGQWCALLAAHDKRYIQHACGHLKALVAPMQAHGVHAIESISPPPTGNISIADARKILGDATCIIGGIEPTLFLRLGEEEFAPYVETVIAEAAGGPFILANSDSCPPGVSVDKFKIAAAVARAHTF